MTRRFWRKMGMAWLFCGTLVLSLLNAQDKPQKPAKPAGDQPAANREGPPPMEELFRRFDENKDGQLSLDEFRKLHDSVTGRRGGEPGARNGRPNGPPNAQRGNQPRPLPEGVRKESDLSYVANGHERQKLDLYLPTESTGPRPLVVFIHGGGWRAGDKGGCPGIPLVNRGYVVASINYRLSGTDVFPAQIEDCKAAIRWLRANTAKYGIDPRHVGVWGGSAGGHLVALLGVTGETKEFDTGANTDQSSKVQAVLDWYGPSDFRKMSGRDGSASVGALLGGSPAEKVELAAKASPVTFVSKSSAPFLIVHGEEDKVVGIEQSELLADALKKAGVEVTFTRIPGAGHGGPEFMNQENRDTLNAFFDKHLKGD